MYIIYNISGLITSHYTLFSYYIGFIILWVELFELFAVDNLFKQTSGELNILNEIRLGIEKR